ncbi:hypothetical protein R3P38DRAFT_3439607 [Favolaschia claudopus]|uniref:Uncharacterized protein n=1 Tax=Favolaschia claudopus TaxID=2862362 RepID=A0AAV9ZRW4_9AGAR
MPKYGGKPKGRTGLSHKFDRHKKHDQNDQGGGNGGSNGGSDGSGRDSNGGDGGDKAGGGSGPSHNKNQNENSSTSTPSPPALSTISPVANTPQSASSSAYPSPTSTEEPSLGGTGSTPQKGLGTSMIVAISLASVFVVIASALTLFFCWRRRRRRATNKEKQGGLSANPYPFTLIAAPRPTTANLDFVNKSAFLSALPAAGGTMAPSSSYSSSSATFAFRGNPLLSSSQSQDHFSEQSTDVDTLHRQPTILSSVSHSSSATRGSLYPTFVTGYDNPRSARIAEYLAQLPPVSSPVLEEEDESSAGGSKGKEKEESIEPP